VTLIPAGRRDFETSRGDVVSSTPKVPEALRLPDLLHLAEVQACARSLTDAVT
jgi:hypothetical protein